MKLRLFLRWTFSDSEGVNSGCDDKTVVVDVPEYRAPWAIRQGYRYTVIGGEWLEEEP